MIEIKGYKIIKQLGRGGMAAVYLALQESLERYVALKVLSAHLSTENTFCDRFMREARIAARFLHRSIVGIYDINSQDGRPYMAMEYLSGGTLGSRMKGLTLEEKLVVAAEIADALDFMHRQSFIHRDVKPDNIIFRADGSAVITDFGIARAANSATRMTLTGSILGTPHYMSPEQARGKKIGYHSDLYSLGVVLFKMLSGRLPYDAEDQFSICAMHVNEPIPQLPDEIQHFQPVIERLLAKSPENRYQSGEEARLELERIAGTGLLVLRTAIATPEVESSSLNDDPATRIQTPGGSRSEDGPVTRSAEHTGPTGQATGDTLSANHPASEENGTPASEEPLTDEAASLTMETLAPKVVPVWQRPLIRATHRLQGFLLTTLALTRIRLRIISQHLERLGGLRGILRITGVRLKDAWIGPLGLLRRPGNIAKTGGSPEVWLPPALIAASLIAIVTLTSTDRMDREAGTVSTSAILEPAPTSNPEVEGRPHDSELTIALEQFSKQASEPADWLLLDLVLQELDIRAEDLVEIPIAPPRNELALTIMGAIEDAQGPQVLPSMVASTLSTWLDMLPKTMLPGPISEVMLLEELEQMAVKAIRPDLDRAMNQASKGLWDDSDGAWSEIEKVLMLIPDQIIADQAISEMRLLWLEHWQTLLEAQDAEAAERLFDSAFQAGILGEQWMQEQSRQLEALSEAIEHAEIQERVSSLLARANQSLDADRLMIPEDRNAYRDFQKVLEIDPGNHAAMSGIIRIAERYAELTREALDREQYTTARNHLDRAEQLAPDLAQLPELREWLDAVQGQQAASPRLARNISLPRLRLSGRETAQQLIERGEGQVRSGESLLGYAYFMAALEREPNHPGARHRLDQRAQRYIRLATRDIHNNDLQQASENLGIVQLIAPDHPDFPSADRALRNALDRQRGGQRTASHSQAYLSELRLKVLLAEAESSIDRMAASPGTQRLAIDAGERLDHARRIAPQNSRVQQLWRRYVDIIKNSAEAALDANDDELAGWFIDRLAEIDPRNSQLRQLRSQLPD
ncbi:MAG: serine/threonine protein kinase [Wenzhouxiangella sp.]|nr:MAG: serine/threonine protein kinase [Wenzhouxiangella sp.]